MQIKEFRCTCMACRKTWYYGYEEMLMADASDKIEAGKACLCCSGCLPILAVPKIQTVDVTKCPRCGSRAIKKETVIHEV